jgi:hypothetical protein
MWNFLGTKQYVYVMDTCNPNAVLTVICIGRLPAAKTRCPRTVLISCTHDTYLALLAGGQPKGPTAIMLT